MAWVPGRRITEFRHIAKPYRCRQLDLTYSNIQNMTGQHHSKLLIIFLTLLFLLIYSIPFAQTRSYQALLDCALDGHGSIFVFSKPLKVTRLKTSEMQYYSETVKNYSGQNLDTVMFSQIIQNSKTADTSLWTDDELPRFLLVNEREETVSKKYTVQKFRLADKKQIKFYNKQVQFNRNH